MADSKVCLVHEERGSAQQQKAITSFTTSSSLRHLVLAGPAGTGKTVVALQVANNLVRELEGIAEPGKVLSLLLLQMARRRKIPSSNTWTPTLPAQKQRYLTIGRESRRITASLNQRRKNNSKRSPCRWLRNTKSSRSSS